MRGGLSVAVNVQKSSPRALQMSRRSKAKRARSCSTISEDEILDALERIVPCVALPTVTFVAEELAACFDVTADEIKEAHRDLRLTTIPDLINSSAIRFGASAPHADSGTSKESSQPNEVCEIDHQEGRGDTNEDQREAVPIARQKLTTRKRLKSCSTTPNEAAQSGINAPTTVATTTDKHPSPATRPSSAAQKQPQIAPPSQKDRIRSPQQSDTATKPSAQHDSPQHKRRPKAGSDGGKTKLLDTTINQLGTQPAHKQSTTGSDEAKAPKRSSIRVAQSRAPPVSQRCIDNLKAIATAAGLLSPRSKLACKLRSSHKDSERASLVRGALKAEFRGSYPTRTEIEECKQARERMKELEDIDVRNIIPVNSRPRRLRANRRLQRMDPPELARADPSGHFALLDNEEKEDDSDASAPSATSSCD